MSRKDYNTLSTELDDLLESLQVTELDIDQAVKAYERGMAIITELEALLKLAENKVVKIQNSKK